MEDNREDGRRPIDSAQVTTGQVNDPVRSQPLYGGDNRPPTQNIIEPKLLPFEGGNEVTPVRVVTRTVTVPTFPTSVPVVQQQQQLPLWLVALMGCLSGGFFILLVIMFLFVAWRTSFYKES